MEEKEVEHRAQLRITEEEAHHVADLLRYAISLNTTVGLVSPTERRLATPTYYAVELAARILEGKPFQDAVRESAEAWTGSLEKDYQRALELVQSSQDSVKQAMTQYMGPEQFSRYLEVSQNQFLEIMKTGMSTSLGVKRPEK